MPQHLACSSIPHWLPSPTKQKLDTAPADEIRLQRVKGHITKGQCPMRKKQVDPSRGQRLREVRIHREMSQGALARPIAVKVGTVQGYEHGRIEVSATKLEQLARALQCEVADLMMPPGAPMPRYRYPGDNLMRPRRPQRQAQAARQPGGRRKSQKIRPNTARMALFMMDPFWRDHAGSFIDPFALLSAGACTSGVGE